MPPLWTPLVLVTPANSAIMTGGDSTTGATYPPFGVPSFVWERVTGATQYEVNLSTTPGFDKLVVPTNNTTFATTYTPPIALADGEYFCACVQPTMAKLGGLTPRCAPSRKIWSNNGRNAPQLLSPPDQSQRIAFTQDDFSREPGDRGCDVSVGDRHRFRLSSNVVYKATTLAAQHTPTKRLQNNDYYWRVTPVDNQHNLGKPSAAHSFTFNWERCAAVD